MDKLIHTKEILKKLRARQIVYGCSGGVDSMVLLYLLYKEGLKPEVIHVNYQKRGLESNLDAQLVAQSCRDYNFEYSIIEYETTETGNFQELARNFRMNILKNRHSEGIVLLAHHADDQVETFFMNLCRKSGIMGLAAMEELSSEIARPLFRWNKSDIYAFAKVHSIQWREDISNSENDYVRNQWRNVLIPIIEQEIPTIKQSVFFLAEKFQETQSRIEVKVQPILTAIKASSKTEIKLLKMLPEDYLFEVWRQLNQEPSHFNSFKKLLESQKGKQIILKGNYNRIIHEGDFIYFEKAQSTKSSFKLLIKKVNDLPNHFDKSVIYLDPEKLSGELSIRKWKFGDKVAPVGMKGTKLVSDILTDTKIPHHLRNDIYVVTDEKNVLWIPGVKVGRIGLADHSSKSIIEVMVNEIN